MSHLSQALNRVKSELQVEHDACKALAVQVVNEEQALRESEAQLRLCREEGLPQLKLRVGDAVRVAAEAAHQVEQFKSEKGRLESSIVRLLATSSPPPVDGSSRLAAVQVVCGTRERAQLKLLREVTSELESVRADIDALREHAVEVDDLNCSAAQMKYSVKLTASGRLQSCVREEEKATVQVVALGRQRLAAVQVEVQALSELVQALGDEVSDLKEAVERSRREGQDTQDALDVVTHELQALRAVAGSMGMRAGGSGTVGGGR